LFDIRVYAYFVGLVLITLSVSVADDGSKCIKPKNSDIVKKDTLIPFFKFQDRKLHKFTFALNEVYSYISKRAFESDAEGSANLIYLSDYGIIENRKISNKASRILREFGLAQNISGANLNSKICSLQTFFKADGSHAYSVVLIEKGGEKATMLDYKCIVLATASMYGCEFNNQALSVQDMLVHILKAMPVKLR